ncbi:hypothetical protein Goshw_012369, partial [Gossypium schwendimanii]|nr:hypothetical protein [Gossypium schwendimanii]
MLLPLNKIAIILLNGVMVRKGVNDPITSKRRTTRLDRSRISRSSGSHEYERKSGLQRPPAGQCHWYLETYRRTRCATGRWVMEICHILREGNKCANHLVNLAQESFGELV